MPVNSIVPNLYRREIRPAPVLLESSSAGSSPSNVGAIAGGVLAGVVVTILFFIWYSVYRKRKTESHVEEAAEQKERPAGWLPTLKSAFSPDEKEEKGIERFRDAFNRWGAKKSQDTNYEATPFPAPTNAINRPPPAVPGHIPRYPSILERGYSKTARHPPPSQNVTLQRLPSVAESLRSAPAGDRASRRKIQIPPRALLVPPSGRPLPGFAGRVVQMARSPRSPSRRKSWLSKRLSKHPFIPSRDDPSLHFISTSPLRSAHYHPSRHHLEARLDSKSPKEKPRRAPVKRQPVPLFEEDGGTTKHKRLVDAVQKSGSRTPGIISSTRVSLDKQAPSSAYI
jgi:hypothetical protein